ncbi:NYN domain-containing protein [Corynebacterium crudilactis]|uniref:NYN domain-containing protein n=1 Tax=Corynebacterium crudilactis TaxID=1652495 RepID=A0A172QWL2_9CORY|nr:NYN domain-containing protein [Corynebacterium crudilactis]ANE05104.1 NYN domain-containing protein [Corynebacterium crudilactis]
MLERTQVFVDTSYLLASFYNSWETGARAQLEIDLPEVVGVLGRMIEQQLKQPVQRQMWYDGIPDSGPHRYQRALRTCDGVQLRAGQLIEWGERRTQKAVDTRLVADLVLAGVRGQCSDIVLVSGDADMIPGVQEAANAGLRVHLYGFGWDSMSSQLRHCCDTTTILDPREDFADCMQLQVLEGPVPPVVRIKPINDAEPIEDLDFTPVPGVAPAFETQTPKTSENAAVTSEETEETAVAPPKEAQSSPAQASPVQEKDAEQAEEKFSPRPGEPAEALSDQVCEAQNAIVKIEEESAQTAATSVSKPAKPTSASLAKTKPAAQATSSAPAAPKPKPSPGEAPKPGTPKPKTPAPVQEAPSEQTDVNTEAQSEVEAEIEESRSKIPNPSMMAPRRKLRSRYVPLPNEVWATSGFQTPYDVGQQYASWWFENAATVIQRDQAHLLSGGGLPPEIDRPLLQFACETLHEYTLTEAQRVSLRDGFHSGIRGVLLNQRDS